VITTSTGPVICTKDPCAAVDLIFPRNTSTNTPYFTLHGGTQCVTSTAITVTAGGLSFSVASSSVTSTDGNPAKLDILRIKYNLNGNTIAAGSTVNVGINACQFTNPANQGSVAGVYEPYSFTIETGVSNTATNDTYTRIDSAGTKTAIGDGTSFSAQVNEIFSFKVGGMPTTTKWGTNGEYPSVPSTSTTCPFGTLQPNVPKTCGQTLTIASNAPNGYVVYVMKTGLLQSGTNYIYDFVANGAGVVGGTSCMSPDAPLFDLAGTCNNAVNWVSPYALINYPDSFGHLGYSSDDTDVFTTSTLYAGIANSFQNAYRMSPVMASTTAPASASHTSHVKLKIEVSPLLPVGHYATTIYYVATALY
jgi:hypothetical protein